MIVEQQDSIAELHIVLLVQNVPQEDFDAEYHHYYTAHYHHEHWSCFPWSVITSRCKTTVASPGLPARFIMITVTSVPMLLLHIAGPHDDGVICHQQMSELQYVQVTCNPQGR